MTTHARARDLVGTRPTLSLVAPGGDVTRRVAVTCTRTVELSADGQRVRLTALGLTVYASVTATIELEEPPS